MLDNRNSGLEPSFIDQAWEDMRRQLDEAMPVESKKRRPVLAWWWWAAALLLPTLIGIGLYPRAQAPTLQALPIPGVGKAIASPQNIPQLDIQNPIVESASASISSSNSSNQTPVVSTETPTHNAPAVVLESFEQKSPAIVENQDSKPLTNDTQVIAEKAQALYPVKEQKNTIGDSKHVVANRQLLPVVDEIPTQLSFDSPERDLSLEKEVEVSPVNSRYAVEVGTSTRSFLTFDGYFVGLNKEWQKKSSRWSFGLGLHYRQQMIPFETSDLLKVNTTRENADQLNSPILEETLNSGAFAAVDFSSGVARFVSGDSSINVPLSSLNLIQRLHYIEIPTYANFRLGRKWETFANVRFSYLAKAYLDHTHRPVSRATEDFANHSGGGQTGNYASQLASNTRLGTNTSDFQRFMLSAAMGFTYYPSPQIGWRLQYSSTPVSLYKVGSINTRDHWLGTSLIWRFGGR
ncbi:MAG: outer membrane beta-barrel protein [Cyanothece sp. SIO1E1]|nr:outer membrane beta-barrel protein [Cyanothece sp. SIO1E1]